MIFDGKKEAEKVLQTLGDKASKLDRTLTLAIIYPGKRPCQKVFSQYKKEVAQKIGVQTDIREMPDKASPNDYKKLITELSTTADGILIQLPIEESIDRYEILNQIPFDLDVEGLSAPRVGELAQRIPEIYSPVAKSAVYAAQMAIGSDGLAGKETVIVGNSYLTGRPAAQVLSHLGATVTICDINTRDLASHTKRADVVISGTGQPHLIKPDMVKEGVVAIDVGFEPIEDQPATGDMHPDIAQKAALFTPVPGGIGPMTIAFIFDNLFKLTR